MKVLPFTILYADDKSVIAERLEQPHFYPYLHRHDEFQLTWIERGEGILIAGNNMHAFKAGDLFLIGSNLPHLLKSNPEYFEHDPATTVKSTSLYFNAKGSMNGLFDLPEMKSAKNFLQLNRHGFRVHPDWVPGISAKMLKVYETSGAQNLISFVELLSALQQLEQSEPLCPIDYSANISDNEGIRLSNILNFIMERYHTALTLEEVSNAAFMTPQAFCRYFKRHTGRKFVAFLNEVRINEACKSLTASKRTDSISDAAYKAGFNSITNFNRVFKSVIGRSPRAYMEAYKRLNKY
ncbi:AraC family transcriptional regulator [Pedobacter yulinensis]|uniref:AraC family transcriptional regulator n=1 Tax=Pedobacter yulinensis TaxID=2126353 RepID=A0A2T3HQG3_9SPHI|nr:AraC family transcriptional regulator [Pedobacter yulinensis]PST84688.1 AraC family transcriptional regulator [Pedobacter yulinensis]